MVKPKRAYLLIALVFFAAYWREVLFLQINALLMEEQWNYANTLPLATLSDLTNTQLYQLKWLMTLFFAALIGGCSLWTIRLLCKKGWLKKVITILYSILVGLSLLLGCILYLTDNHELFYPLLRQLIGLFQTPLLLIILGITTYAINHLSELQNPKI